MNTFRKHSPRRSAAQWHQIVEAQLASGLSAPRFCEEKQISYASFINWKKKLNPSASAPSQKLPEFIELTPQPDSTTPTSVDHKEALPLHIELDLGSGIQLRIRRVG